MGIRVVMEIEGDNDGLHERRLDEACKLLEVEPGGSRVERCVITAGKVTIEESFEGDPNFRAQRIVR